MAPRLTGALEPLHRMEDALSNVYTSYIAARHAHTRLSLSTVKSVRLAQYMTLDADTYRHQRVTAFLLIRRT